MIVNTILLAEGGKDSLRVVSSGWDGNVCMWNVKSEDTSSETSANASLNVDASELIALGQGNYVNSLAWGTEGQSVFAGGKEGMLVKIRL